MTKLSVITPVFGKSQLTIDFIQSIVPYLDDSELIIVDNNSSDNTLAALGTAKKLYPDLKLTVVSNPENVGFGAANNIGARLAKADKLLFISNDVKILSDIVSPVLEYLGTHNRDACGPRLIATDSGWNTFKESGTIPYLEGFCFATHRAHFDLVGGFDEKFFLDMEDLDLCFRLRLAGVGLAQINLPVLHTLGGSFSELSVPRMDITLQSLAYFMRKYNFTR